MNINTNTNTLSTYNTTVDIKSIKVKMDLIEVNFNMFKAWLEKCNGVEVWGKLVNAVREGASKERLREILDEMQHTTYGTDAPEYFHVWSDLPTSQINVFIETDKGQYQLGYYHVPGRTDIFVHLPE